MAILRQLDQLENGLSLFWVKSPEEIGAIYTEFYCLVVSYQRAPISRSVAGVRRCNNGIII